jgi:hypothetical protein
LGRVCSVAVVKFFLSVEKSVLLQKILLKWNYKSYKAKYMK